VFRAAPRVPDIAALPKADTKTQVFGAVGTNPVHRAGFGLSAGLDTEVSVCNHHGVNSRRTGRVSQNERNHVIRLHVRWTRGNALRKAGVVSYRRVIVTGGPGAGKTTLLTALEGRGHACVPDTARAIIQDRLRRGSSARPDPAEFASAILRMDIERYREASTWPGPVFFDRAIPDALCMLHDLDLLSMAVVSRTLLDFPYCGHVFVAPPWEAIYTTDGERDQEFAHAVRVHRRASDWYRALGFELIELPRVPRRSAVRVRVAAATAVVTRRSR